MEREPGCDDDIDDLPVMPKPTRTQAAFDFEARAKDIIARRRNQPLAKDAGIRAGALRHASHAEKDE